MEDKTYIEALMNAPSPDECDVTVKEAIERALPRFQEMVKIIVDTWKQISQNITRWRHLGTHRQRQAAWKLHRVIMIRRTRRSSKRAGTYQRKALASF